jgi:PIN domain nuclease of toxin-antitoxin system
LEELFEFADRNQIELIQISTEPLLTLSKLPAHHSDPFDRLIVSQALSEKLILISKDKGLKKYKVKLEWGKASN